MPSVRSPSFFSSALQPVAVTDRSSALSSVRPLHLLPEAPDPSTVLVRQRLALRQDVRSLVAGPSFHLLFPFLPLYFFALYADTCFSLYDEPRRKTRIKPLA
jgi:hypothetical protein